MAFNELRKRGAAVRVSRDGPGPGAYAAAARGDDGSLAVMLANIGEDAVPLSLEIAENSKRTTASGQQQADNSKRTTARFCRITDETRT